MAVPSGCPDLAKCLRTKVPEIKVASGPRPDLLNNMVRAKPQRSQRKKLKKKCVHCPKAMFESNARGDSKAEDTRSYVSILDRLATQLSYIRWGKESISFSTSCFVGILASQGTFVWRRPQP